MSLAIMRLLDPASTQAIDSEINCDFLPEPFSTLDLESLLTVISKIGVLATVSPAEDLAVGPKDKLYVGLPINPDISCPDAAGLMDAAAQVVQDWPKSIESIFCSLADRNPDPDGHHPVHSMFATPAGYRLLGRIKTVDDKVIRVIDDVLENWLFNERNIYIDGRQRPKARLEGDVAIDVADALRRLEGRDGHPLGISAWSAAGAVEMAGRKVSLASVDATLNAIANLECSDFKDFMSIEDWSTRFLYNQHYRRSDAIRDVLLGRIRVRRGEDCGSGLASLRICLGDFLQCMRGASMAAHVRERSPQRRAMRARQTDQFCAAGQLHVHLGELWPDRQIPDVTKLANIRHSTKIRHYFYKTSTVHKYSVVDALDFLSLLFGPAAPDNPL